MLKIFNYLVHRNLTKKNDRDDLVKYIDSSSTQKILEVLLKSLKVSFFMSRDLRQNLDNFNGTYSIKSKDHSFKKAILFKNRKMTILKKEPSTPDLTITFKNAKSFRKLLLTPNPDVLNLILHQEIHLNGNVNYLYKLVAIIRQLQYILTLKTQKQT